MEPCIRNLWLALWPVGIASVVVRANDLPTATPGESAAMPFALRVRCYGRCERMPATKSCRSTIRVYPKQIPSAVTLTEE